MSAATVLTRVPEPRPAARALLLVEDNPGDAGLVVRMLRQSVYGAFEVVHVGSVGEALDALDRGPFACVLLDLSLPDADGLEGVRAIRERDPVLPVVVLTGASDKAVAYGALGEGAQDYLVKGNVDGALLARAVRYAIERGRAESALLARDRQLTEAHLLARMGTWEWDLVTGEVTWSRELYQVLDMQPDDVDLACGAMMRLVHPADREVMDAAFGDAIDGAGTFAYDARLLLPRGTVWTRNVGEVVRDGSGRAVRLFGTSQDTTHVHLAEAALRASERRYRAMVETAVEGVCVIDPDGATSFVNVRMAHLLGHEPEEMLGKPFASFIDRGQREGIAAELALTRTGLAEQRDMPLRRKDGSTIWALLATSPLLDEDGGYAGALAMVSDITDRHAAEHRLRLMHDVVVGLSHVTTLDDAITSVLDRVCPALDLPYAEVWHRPSGERLLELDPIHHGAEWAALRDERRDHPLAPGEGLVGQVWLSREPVVAPDLPAEQGLRVAFAVPVATEETVMAVLVFHAREGAPPRDDTEFAADLTRQLGQFSQRWQVDLMKDTFLNAVSHELRTPLTALIGTATTLHHRRGRLTPAEQDEMLAGVVRGAAKLNTLLADLLDVDRLSRGVLRASLMPVRLDQAVRAVVAANDTLPIEVETVPCSVVVDQAKFERILENLLGNAAKYAPHDSGVTVRLTVEEGMAVLTVDDRGGGVPDELKTAVFEPFRRGEKVIGHAPGTGIGLSLVSGFARLHGGHAWVEDRPGGGASFRVALPLALPHGFEGG